MTITQLLRSIYHGTPSIPRVSNLCPVCGQNATLSGVTDTGKAILSCGDYSFPSYTTTGKLRLTVAPYKK